MPPPRPFYRAWAAAAALFLIMMSAPTVAVYWFMSVPLTVPSSQRIERTNPAPSRRAKNVPAKPTQPEPPAIVPTAEPPVQAMPPIPEPEKSADTPPAHTEQEQSNAAPPPDLKPALQQILARCPQRRRPWRPRLRKISSPRRARQLRLRRRKSRFRQSHYRACRPRWCRQCHCRNRQRLTRKPSLPQMRLKNLRRRQETRQKWLKAYRQAHRPARHLLLPRPKFRLLNQPHHLQLLPQNRTLPRRRMRKSPCSARSLPRMLPRRSFRR